MTHQIVQFPEEVIALNKELASGLHPTLAKHLASQGEEDLATRLGRIAAWCGIEVDGYFDADDIVNLCELIRVRLIDRRERPDTTIIVH